MDLSVIATGQIDLINEELVKPEMGYKKPELVLYDGPIVLIGPGAPLSVDLAITVPIDYEFNASGIFTLEINQRSGYRHISTEEKPIPFKTNTSDCRVEIGGHGMAQIGPKIELSAVILRGLLEGSIYGQVGVRGEAEAAYLVEDLELGEKTHACKGCSSGVASAFVDIKADVTTATSDFYRFKLIGFDICSLKWELFKFYFSFINDEDSLFGGNPHFGLSTCPNYKYRTMVYTKDVDGTEHLGLPVTVLSGKTEKGSGVSPYKIYL